MYALFMIACAPDTKTIPLQPWEQFVKKVENLKLKGENSQLLATGVWQLSLKDDTSSFHELIIAATQAKLEFRYMITPDQLSWIYSS